MENKKTQNAIEKTTATEYCNRFGLTAFQYGETITENTGKLYLTALNCAISANRIKMDRVTNLTISKWLVSLDSALTYAWNNITADGVIYGFDGFRKEDAEDAIHTCLTVLTQYIGREYSKDIQKKVRNAQDKVLNDKCRVADCILTEELNTDTETIETAYRPMYATDNEFHNKELKKAVNACDFSDIDLDILYRISNGEEQKSIAEDIGITQQAVSKKYRKMIKTLQNIMIK